MKIPSDEDIDTLIEEYISGNYAYQNEYTEGVEHGLHIGVSLALKPLEPLLDLVEQLREARKEFDKTKYDLHDFSLKHANDLAGLQELRDKLELGDV